MTDLIARLEEVKALVREKHQAGRHDQSKHGRRSGPRATGGTRKLRGQGERERIAKANMVSARKLQSGMIDVAKSYGQRKGGHWNVEARDLSRADDGTASVQVNLSYGQRDEFLSKVQQKFPNADFHVENEHNDYRKFTTRMDVVGRERGLQSAYYAD